MQEYENDTTKFTTDLPALLDALGTVNRSHFEEWAGNFHLNARANFQRARHEMKAVQALGFAPGAHCTRFPGELARWENQLRFADALASADSEAPALDYNDAGVLLYLALYVALCAQTGCEDGRLFGSGRNATRSLCAAKIDFRCFLSADLLAAPAWSEVV